VVRTKIRLELEADSLERVVELVERLRNNDPDGLSTFNFKVSGVQHLVEPDVTPKEAA
jgi:hypothetical protein